MKIFEIREFSDGGPNDQGTIIGYIKTSKSREQLRGDRKHGFIDYFEITKTEFLRRKRKALQIYNMFNI